MENTSRKILATILSITMIFNNCGAKNKIDLYVPTEPIKIESIKILKRKKKNM